MVEGRLQIEGEVIHVVVNACYNFSSFLRVSPSAYKSEQPQLSFSRADEKSTPAAVNKRTQVREDAQEKIFTKAGISNNCSAVWQTCEDFDYGQT
jgi:error-prone DNA polymerase